MKIPFANLKNRFFHLLASAYEKHDKKQSYQISLVGCYHLATLQMTYVDCPTVRWCLR